MRQPFFVSISSLLTLAMLLLAGCGGTGIPTGSVTGTITINGQPAEGVSLRFVPVEAIRPSSAITDANGSYRAQFVSSQSGVALGPCVVEFSVYRGESGRNLLPKEFNDNAAANPELNIVIPPEGIEFNYDIKYDGEIPPVVN